MNRLIAKPTTISRKPQKYRFLTAAPVSASGVLAPTTVELVVVVELPGTVELVVEVKPVVVVSPGTVELVVVVAPATVELVVVVSPATVELVVVVSPATVELVVVVVIDGATTVAEPPTMTLPTEGPMRVATPVIPPVQLPRLAVAVAVSWRTPAADPELVDTSIVNTVGGSPG